MKVKEKCELDFYGDYLNKMIIFKTEVLENLCNKNSCIQHIEARIKSPNSMCQKLVKKGYQCTSSNALSMVSDAVGVRVICNFLDDVYDVVSNIKNNNDWTIVKERDYIKNSKPNGYRSYHIVIEHIDFGIPLEIQIRTISQDAWASLEHKMKYKKEIKNTNLLVSELKRCADELASTDMSMQTINDLIKNSI